MRTEDANMNRALCFYIYIIPTYFCTYNLTFLTVFFYLLVFLVMFSYQIHVDLGTVAINEAYKYYTNTSPDQFQWCTLGNLFKHSCPSQIQSGLIQTCMAGPQHVLCIRAWKVDSAIIIIRLTSTGENNNYAIQFYFL